MSRRITDCWPASWLSHVGQGTVGVGGDIATTTKGTSNPSAIAVVEKVRELFLVRALIRFKTADGAAYFSLLAQTLNLPGRRRPRAISLDATSERFFAAGVRDRLIGQCPVNLVVSSESTTYLGETMSFKVYLGNMLANLVSEGRVGIPGEEWLSADLRSVKRDGGSFSAELTEDGGHGDCFDAIKLAIHSIIGEGGPAEATAVAVGGLHAGEPGRKLLNPYARAHEARGTTLYA